MMVPAAMFEMIRRYFGFAATPDYSATLVIMQRDPYRPVREALSTLWEIFDLTDYNSDLGFVYALVSHPARLTVRLSLVGPYAVILTEAGQIADAADVADILHSAGFQLLAREVLELPVTAWSPEAEGSVYEFLFEFDRGVPWDR